MGKKIMPGFTQQFDLATVRRHKSTDSFHQGLLSVSGHPYDPKNLPLTNFKINILQMSIAKVVYFQDDLLGLHGFFFNLQHDLTTNHAPGQFGL